MSSVASVVMEYPSGYVSDRLGYKPALVVASLFAMVGWSWYVVASSFWGVLGAELLLGVSYAFISGSDTALLFEVLRAEGRHHQARHDRSRLAPTRLCTQLPKLVWCEFRRAP